MCYRAVELFGLPVCPGYPKGPSTPLIEAFPAVFELSVDYRGLTQMQAMPRPQTLNAKRKPRIGGGLR